MPLSAQGCRPALVLRDTHDRKLFSADLRFKERRLGSRRSLVEGPKIVSDGQASRHFRCNHNMRTILLIVLVLLVIGAFPAWPYSTGWGYYPSGGIGLVLLIIIILAVTGRL